MVVRPVGVTTGKLLTDLQSFGARDRLLHHGVLGAEIGEDGVRALPPVEVVGAAERCGIDADGDVRALAGRLISSASSATAATPGTLAMWRATARSKGA